LKALSSKFAAEKGLAEPGSIPHPPPRSPSKFKAKHRPRQVNAPLSPIHNQAGRNGLDDRQLCGLCGSKHGAGKCYMTESSDNLVEYRYLLLVHGDEEPFEDRVRIPLESFENRKPILSHRRQPSTPSTKHCTNEERSI
jgi:hypothetical protein